MRVGAGEEGRGHLLQSEALRQIIKKREQKTKSWVVFKLTEAQFMKTNKYIWEIQS